MAASPRTYPSDPRQREVYATVDVAAGASETVVMAPPCNGRLVGASITQGKNTTAGTAIVYRDGVGVTGLGAGDLVLGTVDTTYTGAATNKPTVTRDQASAQLKVTISNTGASAARYHIRLDILAAQ